jgi:hypothetical protein
VFEARHILYTITGEVRSILVIFMMRKKSTDIESSSVFQLNQNRWVLHPAPEILRPFALFSHSLHPSALSTLPLHPSALFLQYMSCLKQKIIMY